MKWLMLLMRYVFLLRVSLLSFFVVLFLFVLGLDFLRLKELSFLFLICKTDVM